LNPFLGVKTDPDEESEEREKEEDGEDDGDEFFHF
jgi:hypothetical protein